MVISQLSTAHLPPQIGPHVRFAKDDGANPTTDTGGTDRPRDVRAISQTKRTFSLGKLTVNVFNTEADLNKDVANQIAAEMQKPGLMILPADSTHGDEPKKKPGEIYSLINEKITSSGLNIHDGLFVTHMDELDFNSKNEHWGDREQKGFADSLKGWLPNLMSSLRGERFYAFDTEYLKGYDDFISKQGGPRVIVGGVGADTPPHIAYIAEHKGDDGKPLINKGTFQVTLRPSESKRRGVDHAVTMGMGLFDADSLEKVIIDAKGEHKAAAILYALNDGLKNVAPDGESALGQLIRKYTAKGGQDAKGELILNLDAAAFKTAESENFLTLKS